jgi:hypothetical protein
MKHQSLYRVAAVFAVLCGFSAAASAQRSSGPSMPMPPASGNDPIEYARTAYRQAAHILKGALPIYSGHDGKALDAVKRAEKSVNDFVKERSGDYRVVQPEVSSGAARGARGMAMQRVAITITDAAQYTPQQVKVSLARLQFAQSLIKTATARLNAIQGVRSISLSEAIVYGQMSSSEIDKAINEGRTVH